MILSRSDRLAASLLEDDELLDIDLGDDALGSTKDALLSDGRVDFIGPDIRGHFESLDRRLGRKQKIKVANNTYLVRRGQNIAVRYHATDILTVEPDSTCTVSMTGTSTDSYLNRFGDKPYADRWVSGYKREWKTRSTMARLSDWLPGGWQIVTRFIRGGDEWWCWFNRSVPTFADFTVEIEEGDRITPDGVLEYSAKPISLKFAPWKEARNARRRANR